MKTLFKFSLLLLMLNVLTLSSRAVDADAKKQVNAALAKVKSADAFFGQKQWSQAADAYAAATTLFVEAEENDGEANDMDITITIAGNNDRWAIFYGYVFDEGGNFTIAANGKTATTRLEIYRRIISTIARDAAILAGRKQVPIKGRSDGQLEELSSDDLESFAREAALDVNQIKFPLNNVDGPRATFKLRRAILKLETLLPANPQWRDSPQSLWNISGEPELTGAQILASAKTKLVKAEKALGRAQSNQNEERVSGINAMRSTDLDILDSLIKAVKGDGWMRWEEGHTIASPRANYIAARRAIYTREFKARGATMPANFLQPLSSKLTQLRALVVQRASKFSFAAGVHNAAMESLARQGLTARYRGVRVLKTSIRPGGWRIQKNEYDLPQYRVTSVNALLQMPGETLRRQVVVGYTQDYAGGGSYNSSAHISEPYDVRFTTAR